MAVPTCNPSPPEEANAEGLRMWSQPRAYSETFVSDSTKRVTSLDSLGNGLRRGDFLFNVLMASMRGGGVARGKNALVGKQKFIVFFSTCFMRNCKVYLLNSFTVYTGKHKFINLSKPVCFQLK